MKFHDDDEIVHTDWEEFEEDETHFQKHRHKYITIISLVLLLITITTFFPQLTARFFSTQLSGHFENDTLVINDEIKIIMSSKVHQDLINIYDKNQPLEMKACLRGEIIESTQANNKNRSKEKGQMIYNVSEIYVPTIIKQGYDHVQFIPCDIDTIIDLHSHPQKNCLLSNTDFNTFNQLKKQNNNLLMGVMCSHNEFIFII